MRKLFFTFSVALALIVSAVFTVQKAMAAGTASWVCVTGGATLTWSGVDPASTGTLTTPAGSITSAFGIASFTSTRLNGNGTYSLVSAAEGIHASITCPTTTTTTVVNDPPLPPPPFWVNELNGNKRIDADPGEKFAVYCYPGGFVDIWNTSGKPFEFATTTYSALNSVPMGGSTQLPNLNGGTFTASKDATGKFITVASGENSKTFSLTACETWVNYKEDVKVNNPQGASYTANTSAVITNQLNAAKARLASAVGAAAIAQAQADVARWEALYRSNNTVITENADGSTTFQFGDGKTITVLKDGTVQ